MDRKVLIAAVAILILACGRTAFADGTTSITDPADLHVGTGAGTSCATGCAGDPNTITAANFDIYYNPNTNSSQAPIGTPFYLILAIPVYTGSISTNSINSPAGFYDPYASPFTQTGTVPVSGQTDHGTLTSGSIYTFLGLGSSVTNSFRFDNMVACDIGTSSGSNACPNGGLHGSAAPLFGQTITGYEIVTWNIGTSAFSPQDLLNFSGSIPIGSYVAAIGVNTAAGEAWAVPFTESGLVVPEPASLSLVGLGLVALGSKLRRKLRKQSTAAPAQIC